MPIIYPSSKARKERIYRLLDEAASAQEIEDPACTLEACGVPPSPTEIISSLPWFRSGMLASLLGFLTIAYYHSLPLPYNQTLLALVATAMLQSIAFCIMQTVRVQKASKCLRAELHSLRTSRDSLNAYLDDVDRRTRKYFHCVTNSKITTYCILKQILLALDERVRVVEPLLRYPTAKSSNMAAAKLAEDLQFSEGFLKNTGKERFVAPQRIQTIICGLQEEFETSLKELEAEIVLIPHRTQSKPGSSRGLPPIPAS